jgi:hypothetical protein
LQIESRKFVDDRLGSVHLVDEAASIGGCLRGIFDVCNQPALAAKAGFGARWKLEYEAARAYGHVEIFVPALHDRIFHSNHRMGG